VTPTPHNWGIDAAALRVSDAMRAVIAAQPQDRKAELWMAFDFETGEPFPNQASPTVFDYKREAIRHTQNRARQFMFLKVPIDDVPPRAAAVMLRLHRQMAKIGQHPNDADGDWMMDARLEAYPSYDPRRAVATQFDRLGRPHTPGGLYLPGGNQHDRRHRP
jgi:hypothetical protein